MEWCLECPCGSDLILDLEFIVEDKDCEVGACPRCAFTQIKYQDKVIFSTFAFKEDYMVEISDHPDEICTRVLRLEADENCRFPAELIRYSNEVQFFGYDSVDPYLKNVAEFPQE